MREQDRGPSRDQAIGSARSSQASVASLMRVFSNFSPSVESSPTNCHSLWMNV